MEHRSAVRRTRPRVAGMLGNVIVGGPGTKRTNALVADVPKTATSRSQPRVVKSRDLPARSFLPAPRGRGM